jgi:hypothetical protein
MEKGQVIESDDDGNLSVKAVGFTSADGTKCDTHQKELIGAIGGSRGNVTHTPEYNAQGQQQQVSR